MENTTQTAAAQAQKLDLDDLKKRLFAQPLLAGLDEGTLGLLEFELRLLCDPAYLSDEAADLVAEPDESGQPRRVQPRSSYVSVERYGPDQVVVNQGDLTTHLYLVLSGELSSVWARPEGGTEILEALGPGSWFGEVSALSHHPVLTTLRTGSDCELATIDARLFKVLYDDETFKERIDQRYRENSLVLHLRVAPLFARVPPEELDLIRDKAEFLSVAADETLAEEGDEADAFYLVRAGAVACRRDAGKGRRKVLAYFRGNSSFGEHCVSTDSDKWPGTLVTLSPTDVVKVARETFRELREANPGVYSQLTRTANLLLKGDIESLERVYSDRAAVEESEIMVERESVKGGRALVIDKTKCIRCNACVEACVSVHDDRVPRISKMGTQLLTDDVLITACYHCEVPGCMIECPHGAIRRDPHGEVVFIYDNCVGCANCIDGCPYGVIRMVPPPGEIDQGGPTARRRSFWSSLPLVGRLFGGWSRARGEAAGTLSHVLDPGGGEPAPVKGKTIKCDHCAGLPFEACVYNCPTFAIDRRAPEDLFKR
jgi:CRP-like cAMP-binding protein